MSETLRLCTHPNCMQFKPISEFSKRAASSDGLNRYCKECMSRYYRSQSPSRSKRKKGGASSSREASYRRHLKRKYNMTPEEFEALSVAQGGKCAICSREGKLVVDHDHESGKVRGLLCKNCNYTVTGDLNWARAVVRYLEAHSEGK
jgi:hypothetical protein